MQGQTLTIGASIYDTDGTYFDTLSTINGCDSIITTNLSIVIDGIEGEIFGLNIYPNPLKDFVVINADEKIKTIKWTDTKGRFVTTMEINSKHYRINTTSFEAGVYFYKIISESGKVSRGKMLKYN